MDTIEKMHTIGDLSLMYEALLRNIKSAQEELVLLRNGPHDPLAYQAQIQGLEDTISRLSQKAEGVYALLAHAISFSVLERHRKLMADFLLRQGKRADIADTYNYNYYYICHVIATYCRRPLLPFVEGTPYGTDFSE